MLIPYNYQKRVNNALREGRNVILVIPTGMGKTHAATLPFFQSCARRDGLLPEKVLYVVPMRVLATQFELTCNDLYSKELNPDLFLEIEARYKRFHRNLISIQTGESPDDPQFESMITACTIDQLLASALGIPYSLDTRKANLNVAAIASSYLILDEPHLYPVAADGKSYKGAFTTCLELLRLLHGLTRFVFMSATMSSALVGRLSTLLDADLIELDDAELEELNKGRRRVFSRSSEPLTVPQILQAHDQHHHHCSMVVCNTVQRAQETYLQLSEALKQQQLSVDLRLLHSRFTAEDRKKQGKELARLLGKEQWKEGVYQGEKDVIIVATQVVEVGLDIAVHTLHTELAPANSLVQRAGRCARFEHQQGHVIVYPLRPTEDNKPASTLPYNADLCQLTWNALEEFDGCVMEFRAEQQLINTVHTPGDLALLDRYEAHRDDLQGTITTMLRTCERGNASELIRDVNQVQLIIHNEPDEELKIRPWRWQSFGLHPSALMGKHWRQLQDRQQECDLPWLIKQAEKDKKEQQDEEEDNRLPTIYNWSPITDQNQVPGALIIAMPQQIVTYDQELGLVFRDGRLALPQSWEKRLNDQQYQSSVLSQQSSKKDDSPTRVQTYKQHIGGLADAYHYAIYHELAYAIHCLEQLMQLETGTIDHAIQLAIATHDLGKLDAQWQRWARAWQRLLHDKAQRSGPYREYNDTFFFAKTDYDYRSKAQKEWQRELTVKRPKHACESVMAARRLIMQSLGVNSPESPNYPVVRAVCSAIAHHHTPTAHQYGTTSISTQAHVAIKTAFAVVCRDESWTYDLDRLLLTFDKGDLCPVNASEGRFTQPDVGSGPAKLLETWLAFLIVRALRLADQRADLYL